MSVGEHPTGAAPRRVTHWHSINWRKVWRTVRRLQARIVKAVRLGRWNKVKSLVYLLTHSFSGRAAAIWRVTSNKGAKTPGVDQVLWDTPQAKTNAFRLLRAHGYHPQPLRRVYIPKSSDPTKKRPLGIPTLTDRAMQALYLLGLDPIGATLGDPHSYAYQRECSCADALSRCYRVLGYKRSANWIWEGDIKACFDTLAHDWLLAHVPMDRTILRKWLKAGYREDGVLFATTEGTPQGGIISAALANWSLDGLEQLLAEHFAGTDKQRRKNKVHLVRYADDLVITGTSKALLRNKVQPLVEHFLAERGLRLSHEKTSIIHSEDGFDFLGQKLRRYPDGTFLLKPSKKNVQRFLAKIRKVLTRDGPKLPVGEVIRRLNPKIRGWALYHRHASSKKTYSRVDHRIFEMIWRWLRRRHPHKGRRWLKARYFKRQGQRDWILHGEIENSKGEVQEICLLQASAVQIVRHVEIQSEANPYDPQWEAYFEERRSKSEAEWCGSGVQRLLWEDQKGHCPVCGQPLREGEEWQIHHLRYRVYGGEDTIDNLALLHGNCHRQIHQTQKK